MKTMTGGRPLTGWQTLLAALFCVLVLAGCNDSSGNGNGDDNEENNGNGEEASNGNGGSASEGQDTDRVLLYEELDFVSNFPDRPVFAVNANDPEDITEITPTPHDSELATGGMYSGLSSPDSEALPLGVLGGEFSDGELTNANYQYTVYNTEAGELYRLDAGNGDTTAVRFSSEDNASGICTVFVAPDLADIDNSRLIYQVSEESNCDNTEIRMARIGDDESGDVVILRSDVTDETLLDTTAALRDSDGGLTEILFHIDGDLVAYNLASGEQTTLKDDLEDFSVLGYANGGGTLIFMRDRSGTTNVGTFRAYSETDGVANLGSWALNIGIDESNSVQVGNNLYVVDHSESAVIEINGTEATVIDSDWSTGPAVQGVTAANGYLAFAYETQDKWNIRQVALSDGSASDIATAIDDAQFSMNNAKAPGSSDSYWFLYNDLSDDDPVARGVEFTTGGGNFELDNARWRGETWSRTVGETGFQAEYLFYQENGQEGPLFSLNAADPANSSGQDMGVQDLTWGIWVGGFGPETLMIGREGQSTSDNTREVLHIDASTADSAVRITDDEDADHRPISYY